MLRPFRQACGLIAGASMVNRNAYARYISIRVRLEGDIAQEELKPSYLFPHADEDVFLQRLLEFQQRRALALGPFALARPGRPSHRRARLRRVGDALAGEGLYELGTEVEASKALEAAGLPDHRHAPYIERAIDGSLRKRNTVLGWRSSRLPRLTT